MRKLTLWVFPLGVLIGGPFLMIAILLYRVGNNLWTYGQQHLILVRLDQEDRSREHPATQARSSQPRDEPHAVSKPKPDARPVDPKKKRGRE